MTFRPHPKPSKKPKRNNQPTAADRIYWGEVAALGCSLLLVKPQFFSECSGRITIHHCGTGGGGRKDHEKVAGLCHGHHQKPYTGIDSRQGISKRQWQIKYCTENELLEAIEKKLLERKDPAY